MRDIEFRAWDESNNVMHSDFKFIDSGDSGNDWVVFTSDKNTLENDPHPFDNPHFRNQLKIMQYTGLKDSEGTKIFEGDIIEVLGNKNGSLQVEFKNEYVGGWVLTHCDSSNHISLGARSCSEIKVIGNIYQNPELIAPHP